MTKFIEKLTTNSCTKQSAMDNDNFENIPVDNQYLANKQEINLSFAKLNTRPEV